MRYFFFYNNMLKGGNNYPPPTGSTTDWRRLLLDRARGYPRYARPVYNYTVNCYYQFRRCLLSRRVLLLLLIIIIGVRFVSRTLAVNFGTLVAKLPNGKKTTQHDPRESPYVFPSNDGRARECGRLIIYVQQTAFGFSVFTS